MSAHNERVLTYLRNTIAGSPEFGEEFQVINIDRHDDSSLIIDLNDGTSLVLNVERIKTEGSK